MAVSTTDLIAKVKALVPEMKSDAHNSRILMWLNDERRKLINDSGGGRAARRFEDRRYYDLVADTRKYGLPDDFLELKANGVAVRADADSEYTRLERGERMDVDDYDEYADDKVYALSDNCILITPTPSAVVTKGLRLDYYSLADDWTDTTVDIGLHWHRFQEILAVGAAIRSGIRYEDDRMELERHYDRRLWPQFLREFPARDRTAKRMQIQRPMRRHGRWV